MTGFPCKLWMTEEELKMTYKKTHTRHPRENEDPVNKIKSCSFQKNQKEIFLTTGSSIGVEDDGRKLKRLINCVF